MFPFSVRGTNTETLESPSNTSFPESSSMPRWYTADAVKLGVVVFPRVAASPSPSASFSQIALDSDELVLIDTAYATKRLELDGMARPLANF